MRIAMVSEHASPLAALGGVDAGGQNVYVAALAAGLARLGHDVVVYTRRDDARLPDVVELAPGAHVVHVPAGPPSLLPKDDLAPYMDEFGRWLARDWVTSARKPVVSRDLWEPLITLVNDRGDVSFRWVKGHSGDRMNDLVDALAVEQSHAVA